MKISIYDNAPSPKLKVPDIRLGEVDERILRAINRFHYMTASQTGRLLYSNCEDENRYSQRRLRRLTESGHLQRLRALPTPRLGSAPHVFTLADKGRRFLRSRGVELGATYYRPSEELEKARDSAFMEHTLETVDVLIQAARLCETHEVSMPRLLTERQLRRGALRVPLAGRENTRPVAVIPDAWFELAVANEPAISVSLELDRGTEEQKHWRRKVAALASWAVGPYREAFATNNITIAVVTPSDTRRDKLAIWTVQELEEIKMANLRELFLFTSVAPVSVTPYAFFFDPVWHPAGEGRPISLLGSAESGYSLSEP